MDWSDAARPLKAHVRNLVANACGKGKKRAVMFPAGQALDVALFLSKGILSRKSKLFAIEGDAETAKKMWISLFRLGMGRSATIHNGSAHTLDLSEETDLFFADFCGPGKAEEMSWIRRIAHLITGPGADVFVTFKLNHRGYGFFPSFQREIAGSREFSRELANVQATPTTKTTLEGEIYNEDSSASTKRSLAAHRVAMRKLFSDKHFDMHHVVYRDLDTTTGVTCGSREMSLIHLSNFREARGSLLDWR